MPAQSPEFLDVQVDHVARPAIFVTPLRFGRFEVLEAGEAVPLEYPADSCC